MEEADRMRKGCEKYAYRVDKLGTRLFNRIITTNNKEV